MDSFFRIAKDAAAVSKKRKRMDQFDARESILKSVQLCTLIVDKYKCRQRVYGGDKNLEHPREKKNFEKDISIPLGDQNFRRSYRIKRQSFYSLYFMLKNDLENGLLSPNNILRNK